MMHGVSHGSLNRSASDRNETRTNQSRLEESNWRLSFVWNFSQQFCQVHWKCTERTASQFPQGHLLFWVAAHVNWMQQEFFLKEMFQKVERFDGQDGNQAKCRYRCRIGLWMIADDWGPVMCYPDPHSAGGPNGGLPFRLKLVAKNVGNRNRMAERDMQKPMKNLEFYQLPRCVQRHWKQFYFPWIGVMLILWGCYGMVGWPRWVAVYRVCAMQTCDYSKEVQLAGSVEKGKFVDNVKCSQNALGNQTRWMEHSQFNTCSTFVVGFAGGHVARLCWSCQRCHEKQLWIRTSRLYERIVKDGKKSTFILQQLYFTLTYYLQINRI